VKLHFPKLGVFQKNVKHPENGNDKAGDTFPEALLEKVHFEEFVGGLY